MTDLFEEIKRMISNQFGIPLEDIEEDSLLDEDLSIAELDLEDLIAQIQTKYDINIPSNKTASFKKVSDIVSFLYENAQDSG